MQAIENNFADNSTVIEVSDINNFDCVHALFDAVWHRATSTFQIEAKDHNGTGYFDPLASNKSTDVAAAATDEHGRRVLIIPNGLDRGCNVFFERHTNRRTICYHYTEGGYMGGPHIGPGGKVLSVFDEEDENVNIVLWKLVDSLAVLKTASLAQ